MTIRWVVTTCAGGLLAAAGLGLPWADDRAVDPTRLQVVEGHARLDRETGFLKIPGEIRNDTGQWITYAQVQIRLYDAAGNELRSDSIATAAAADVGREEIEFSYTDRTYIPPGESGVFFFLRDVSKIKGDYASHRLKASARVARRPPRMKVSGFAFTPDPTVKGFYSVSGVIENAGSEGCKSPKAVLAFYGADGRLVSADAHTPDEYFQKILAPGGSVRFRINAKSDEDGLIKTAKAWGDCDLSDDE
jgi:hypothetical protein